MIVCADICSQTTPEAGAMISEPTDDLFSGETGERRQPAVPGLGGIHLSLEVVEQDEQLVLGV